MGLIWVRAESAKFQQQLRGNLRVWNTGLRQWRLRINDLQGKLGYEPNATLSGVAWNAARTLFVDRIGPIVDSGFSGCTWTENHLNTYAAAETPLLGDNTLNERSLESAKDLLNREIYEETHLWKVWLPWTEFDEDVKRLRRQVATLQKKLDKLRAFNNAVNNLFNSEITLVESLRAAICSIQNGRLSADGFYIPASGDTESWRNTLNDYTSTHPWQPDPVFDLYGHYGGNQASLNNRWSRMAEEDKHEIRDLIHQYYPGLDDTEIEKILQQMNATGCGYIGDINTLIARYHNDPDGFRRKFGYPLYKPDGSINYDLLFIDFWCYVQKARKADPTGQDENHKPQGVSIPDYWSDFLKENDVAATVTFKGNATIEDYDTMSKQGPVLISIEPISLYGMDGSVMDNREGYHTVTATGSGTDPDGRRYLIVSSWGNQYKLYPDEYQKGKMDLDHDGHPDQNPKYSLKFKMGVYTYE